MKKPRIDPKIAEATWRYLVAKQGRKTMIYQPKVGRMRRYLDEIADDLVELPHSIVEAVIITAGIAGIVAAIFALYQAAQ